MAQATLTGLDAQYGADLEPAADGARALPASVAVGDVRISVYEDLSSIEQDWRAFEQHADGTVFQTFDWLTTWQRHIGANTGVRPAIVVARDSEGKILFLLPLSIRAVAFARQLEWLGSDLCDYNAPLLAGDFHQRLDQTRFMELWREILQRLQSHSETGYDLVHLEKMPAMAGAQSNVMLGLRVTLNPSGAYLTHLSANWQAFYEAKRSSTTRRRDRTKAQSTIRVR